MNVLTPDVFGVSPKWLLQAVCILVFLVILVSCPRVWAAHTPRGLAREDNLERWNLPVFNQGVGGSYAADARAVQAGFTNPAGLNRIAMNQFTMEYQRWQYDWNLISTALAFPLGGNAALGSQISWLDYGELEPESESELYRPQGSELKAGVTYSLLFTDQLALGLTGNIMTSKIGLEVERKTEASLDLGGIYRIKPNIWLGAVGKNINGSLSYDDKQNKLPTQYRLGVAWYLYQSRLALVGDAVQFMPDDPGVGNRDKTGVTGGVRFLVAPKFKVSLGYRDYYPDSNGMSGSFEFDFDRLSLRLGYVRDSQANFFRMGGTANF